MTNDFIKHDPKFLPAFSDDAIIEINVRGYEGQRPFRTGPDYRVDEPWMVNGWEHSNGFHDIIEFRLVSGTMTYQGKSYDSKATRPERRLKPRPVIDTTPPADELRDLLKEAIDVLHCHHRNTHKPLLDKLRNARSKL